MLIRKNLDENNAFGPSCIENHLMINQSELHKFIYGAIKTASNELIFGGGRFKLKFHLPLSLQYPGTEIQANPFNIHFGNQISILENMGTCEKTVNVSGLQGAFFWLRVCDIEYRMLYNSGLSFDLRDIQKAKELGSWLGISGSWVSTVPDDVVYAQCPAPFNIVFESGTDIFQVKNINGIVQYNLQFFYPDSCSYYVLPLSYYKDPNFNTPVRLFIPPRPPYIWMNTEYLGIFPNAEVYLTDDVLLAKDYQQSYAGICLGNPGGTLWITNLDIQHLQGRSVTIMHTETNESYSNAMAIAERLNTFGITPKFIKI